MAQLPPLKEVKAVKTYVPMKHTDERFGHILIRWIILLLCAALLASQLFGLQAQGAVAASPQSAPVCTVTMAATEGPFWKAGSPERTNLVETGMPGARVTFTGYVYDTNCQPITNAWLDFWQADYYGAYDNIGYTLRGHQYSDANGRYHVETIVPGEYPGRTIHMHVK